MWRGWLIRPGPNLGGFPFRRILRRRQFRGRVGAGRDCGGVGRARKRRIWRGGWSWGWGWLLGMGRMRGRRWWAVPALGDNISTMSERETEPTGLDFVRRIVEEDLKTNKWGGRVATRFPP